MPALLASLQHDRDGVLFDASAFVRLDAADLVHRGVRRLLASRADYSRNERQALHNAGRVCRLAAVNRSPLAMILELAPRAPLPDALWFAEMIRVEIIARSALTLPAAELLHGWEEDANRAGNIAQQEHRERRNRSTLDALVDSMNTQAIASRLLADGSVAEMAKR